VIQIQNRIRHGFLIGFAYYGPDDRDETSELQLHLGLISINLVWL
jgi:hypothetical protein